MMQRKSSSPRLQTAASISNSPMLNNHEENQIVEAFQEARFEDIRWKNEKLPPILAHYQNKFLLADVKQQLLNKQKAQARRPTKAILHKLNTLNQEQFYKLEQFYNLQQKLRSRSEQKSFQGNYATGALFHNQNQLFLNIINQKEEDYEKFSFGHGQQNAGAQKDLRKARVNQIRLLQEQSLNSGNQYNNNLANQQEILSNTQSPLLPVDNKPIKWEKQPIEVRLQQSTITPLLSNPVLHKIKGEDLKPSLSVLERIKSINKKLSIERKRQDQTLAQIRSQQSEEIDLIKKKLAAKHINISKQGLSNSLVTPGIDLEEKCSIYETGSLLIENSAEKQPQTRNKSSLK